MLLQSYFDFKLAHIFRKLFPIVVICAADSLQNRFLSCTGLAFSQKFGRKTQKALKRNGSKKILRTDFVQVYKAKKSQKIHFRWAEIFSTEAEFITRLAEIFCQEFSTLGDTAVGAGLLARSHILRVRINILTNFFFNIKIHSILYKII